MMGISKTNIGVLVCVSALLGATGCKKLTKLLGKDAAQEVEQMAGAALGPSADEQAMGMYAEGYNVLIDDPQKCLSEYFDDVPEEGPQPEEKYRFFPAHTRGTIELGKVKTSFEQAASAASDELKHLEPLAKDALKQLEGACTTFSEVHKYYDAEDFKEDEGKKGKDLHTKMLAAASGTHGALEKLETALSKIEEKQSQKELAQFEKDKDYSYWFRAFSFESKKLLGVTDAAAFDKKFTAMDKVYTQVKAFSDKKGDGQNAAFKSFVGQADRFHSIAKKLGRALNEPEPNPQVLQNESTQLTSTYNSLVSIGNSLRQLEANNLLK